MMSLFRDYKGILYRMMYIFRDCKGILYRKDKSFDPLDLSCLKTSCGVAECRGLASGVLHNVGALIIRIGFWAFLIFVTV